MQKLSTDDLVIVLKTTWKLMDAECRFVPFVNWDESVFRWLFIKAMAIHFPGVNCEREWQRIDLLIRDGDSPILVEFKFYFGPNKRHDLQGNPTGERGRLGPKNFEEFKKCVSDQRRNVVGDGIDISKCRRFIVLAYASRDVESKYHNAAAWYDDIELEGVQRRCTVDGLSDIETNVERKCALLEVTV